MSEPTKINDGGPAFPCQRLRPEYACSDLMEGMTKRDMFAIHATEDDIARWMPTSIGLCDKKAEELGIPRELLYAWAKYKHADAMIAVLKETQ